MFTASLSSPIGPVIVSGDAERLSSVRLSGRAAAMPVDEGNTPLLCEAVAQLTAWFTGKLRSFDIPLTAASTPRGAELRAAIQAIGFGETVSYGEVARRTASGPRAIGQACRRNPFPIIIPCHRVIGAAQSIGYYSGADGVITKRWLIDFESNVL
ncbi:MAG: methylated-DNA--[protein]-cysteine S-methyltransferase [Sphingomonadaceae bacterium]